MFFSLAVIMISGLAAGAICKKMKLPPLLGMLLAGILTGPFVLNLIDGSILGISAELRKMALVIILARAGLSLRLKDLKKVGRPAILMCFIPACFEIAGMVLIAPRLFGVSIPEALVIGAVTGAVSPAVIVPKMLRLMERGYGKNKSIPQMILAGASVDDVFVIVLFSAFTQLAQTNQFSAASLSAIPAFILLGIAVGLASGFLFGKFLKRVHIRDTIKLLLMMSVAFLFISFEDQFSAFVPFSALLAVMCMGIAMQNIRPGAAERLSVKLNKIWYGAEVLLFVLIGAAVNLEYVMQAGVAVVVLIFVVLLFRMAGVMVCLIQTDLNWRERVFCAIAYLPKATVQAAIGGVPLAMGMPCGQIVLTVAVMSIIITAPLGAFLIDLTYCRLL